MSVAIIGGTGIYNVEGIYASEKPCNCEYQPVF